MCGHEEDGAGVPALDTIHLTAEERRMARGVHVRPAADGHYYDPVHAAIADRDELLEAAREVVDDADWRSAPHAFQRLHDIIDIEKEIVP